MRDKKNCGGMAALFKNGGYKIENLQKVEYSKAHNGRCGHSKKKKFQMFFRHRSFIINLEIHGELHH